MPQNNTSSSFLGRLTTSTRSSFMSPKDVRCNVHLLHDSDIIGNEFPRTQSAQTILDYVCQLKHIQEKDFLGLRYQDHHKHRYWLDLTRSINHVVKNFKKEIKKVGKTESMTLHLRFRYYPSDPARLRDPNLRYQLFVQLQRDLLHGRLYCPTSSAAELAALILQAQLGDYNEEKHVGNYVSGYKLLLKQTPKLEERIANNHKELKGKSSESAELEFLEKASQLDTYAFDPYTIKEPHDTLPVYIGASCKGILIYTGQSRTHNIDWSELVKVDYSGKEIRLTLSENYRGQITAAGTPTGTLNGHGPGSPSIMDKSLTKKPLTLKYTCPSGQFAKHLWIHILSQQAFFNETSAQDVKLKFSKPRIPLLSRGSTFRFPSKRVYREIEEEDSKSILFDKSIMETSAVMNETTTSNENEESILNCSTISAPLSSGSGVVRYDLLRQTPRVEQPWLKQNSLKVTTVHDNTASSSSSPDNSETQNNNLSKITNLNLSIEREVSTSPSTSPVPIVHTQQHSDHNSTSFTVHLIKREEVATSSSSTSSTTTTGQQQNLEKNGNGKLANGGGSGVDLGKKTVHTNGTTLICTEEKQDSILSMDESLTSKSLISRIANTCFVFFLILLLIVAIVIVLFEKSEDSAHNDFIESHRALSDLRHLYYEPTRHYVVEQYRKHFGAKI
ncbi:FERM domain-containing protein [Caenorhabditis elegans]|uniref:FERM domain-containing protein n=1 Tax=Caenorhabditis elegans TaxID=6239 RepID=H2KYZ7_CAEEL|nr:FERM domain-containing protein [Caenorhabditis elegans]CCD65429.1 FERM domain-containing protein [Caenorhabditis elegans]|eukprot:NP_001249887.1 FERM domain (protein4.1-ezrin-radixin-moesin) family [Caenorhabditis elegans]